MSTALHDQIGDLSKKVERLGNMLADEGREVSDIHVNDRVAAVSYFEYEEGHHGMTGTQLKNWKGVAPSRRTRRNLPKEYKPQFKSMSDFLRGAAQDNSDFQERYSKATNSLAKAYGMNTYEGESGGLLVLPEFSPVILDRPLENDLWQRTDQYTVAGNTMTFPRTAENSRADGQRGGGIRGYWEAEEHLMTSSRPKLDETSLKLGKLCVVVFVSDEMLQDASYVLEQWVSRGVRREFSFKKGDALVNGVGVKMPQGYLNSPARITVPKVSGQASDTIVGANIVDMWARRDISVPISDYAWYINQEVEPQLLKMTLTGTSGNELVYTPPGGLSSTPYATLMGVPIIPTEFNSQLGDEGDIALAALSQMLSISKGGLQEDTSIHVEFLRGLTAYRFIERCDARPLYNAPLTPYKGTNKTSGFITLADRA